MIPGPAVSHLHHSILSEYSPISLAYHFCWAELTILMMTAARKGLYLWFQSFTFAPAQQTQKHLLLQALALEEGKFKHGNPHRWFAVGTCGYFRGKSIEPAEGRRTSQRLIGHRMVSSRFAPFQWKKKNLLLSKVLSLQNYSSVFQLKTNKKTQIKL